MIKILECGEGCLRGKTKGYLALRHEERRIKMDSVVRHQGAREKGVPNSLSLV